MTSTLAHVSCPYVYPDSFGEEFCTGTEHRFRDHEGKKVCPLYAEAMVWASTLGVRTGFTWDEYDTTVQPEAYDAVQNWVAKKSGLLVLSSPPGAGKSRLAMAAWYGLRRQGHYCLLTSSQRFLWAAIEAAMGRDGSILERFVGPNMLYPIEDYPLSEDFLHGGHKPMVFDDLGAERTSDTFLDAFEQLLNYRDTLLVTTNLGQEEIARRYGDRILSRLRRATVVQLRALDVRTRFEFPK
jgi:hypothetical protein